jgi:hypothetical protein
MTFKIDKVLTFIILLVFSYYIWTALSNAGESIEDSYLPFTHIIPKINESDYYNLLTHSIINGHLYLDTDVPEKLQKLKNPYDPKERVVLKSINKDGSINIGYLYDASFYKAKYYIYFGITPIIILFLPFHFLTNYDLPVPAAILIFVFCGIFSQVILLKNLYVDFFSYTNKKIYYLLVLVVSLCNPVAILLRRPTIYELVISCAFALNCLLVLNLYYFCKNNIKLSNITIISTVLGLLVGARPNFILLIPYIIYIVIKKYTLQNKIKIFSGFIYSLFIPIGIIGICLALYNYIRFDSVFEFGMRYQLAGMYDQRVIDLFNTRYFIYNILSYFFTVPSLSIHYPYFNFTGFNPIPLFIKQPDGYLGTPLLGIFTCFPVFILALFAYNLTDKLNIGICKSFTKHLYILFVLSIILIMCSAGSNFRYYTDFTVYLIILSSIAIYSIEMLLCKRVLFKKIIYRIIYHLSIIISIFATVIGSLELYNCFNSANPELHSKIAYLFETINPFVKHFKILNNKGLHIYFHLHGIKMNMVESIWSSGYGSNSEHVFIYANSDKSIRIGYSSGYKPLPPAKVNLESIKGLLLLSNPIEINDSNDLHDLY